MKRTRAPKRTARQKRTRRSTPAWSTEIGSVRADLQVCTQQVEDLHRTVTSLRAELDHLREKIRG